MRRVPPASAGPAAARALLALVGLTALLVLAAPAGAARADPAPPSPTWAGEQARVGGAQTAGHFGTGVLVAVLDGWVDRTHPDFAGRVLPGADCVGGTCRPGEARDACDHGTHVAGIVASSSFGVAPKALVLPVRVLAYDPAAGACVGRPADVAAGVAWAVGHGATVVNLSLGPSVPDLAASAGIAAAVTAATHAGVVVVFAAGDVGVPVAGDYGPDALIVAATDRAGRLASYSQRDGDVDLAAPGGQPAADGSCSESECVTSLYPGGRYAVAAGTSMAAPYVSGTAALLLASGRFPTSELVVQRLLRTARPLAGAGAGLLDATAALGPPVPAPRVALTARGQTPPLPSTAPAPPQPVARPTRLRIVPAPPAPRAEAPAAVAPARVARVPRPLALGAAALLTLTAAAFVVTGRPRG